MTELKKQGGNMRNEFCPYRDCEFYQAYDEGDDYPPVIKCEKANEWIEDALPCYDCEGKWSAEQIQSYVASEEAKMYEGIRKK